MDRVNIKNQTIDGESSPSFLLPPVGALPPKTKQDSVHLAGGNIFIKMKGGE